MMSYKNKIENTILLKLNVYALSFWGVLLAITLNDLLLIFRRLACDYENIVISKLMLNVLILLFPLIFSVTAFSYKIVISEKGIDRIYGFSFGLNKYYGIVISRSWKNLSLKVDYSILGVGIILEKGFINANIVKLLMTNYDKGMALIYKYGLESCRGKEDVEYFSKFSKHIC